MISSLVVAAAVCLTSTEGFQTDASQLNSSNNIVDTEDVQFETPVTEGCESQDYSKPFDSTKEMFNLENFLNSAQKSVMG